MVPLMSIWRNFFLGAEPRKGVGPLRWFDSRLRQAGRPQGTERDGDRHPRPRPAGRHALRRRAPVGRDRARGPLRRAVLILDEPTSALGVKQAGVVLRYIVQARDRGVAVIFITHNPHHAFPVGDHFVLLNRGRMIGELRQGRDHQGRARSGRWPAARSSTSSSTSSSRSSRNELAARCPDRRADRRRPLRRAGRRAVRRAADVREVDRRQPDQRRGRRRPARPRSGGVHGGRRRRARPLRRSALERVRRRHALRRRAPDAADADRDRGDGTPGGPVVRLLPRAESPRPGDHARGRRRRGRAHGADPLGHRARCRTSRRGRPCGASRRPADAAAPRRARPRLPPLVLAQRGRGAHDRSAPPSTTRPWPSATGPSARSRSARPTPTPRPTPSSAAASSSRS